MPLFRSNAVPTTPTLPKGLEVASFERYLDAQQAVDHLSDEEFPVQHVTIVGTDLHMVERITGRLTYARVAGAGAMSGAWFGLMISVVFWIFMPEGSSFPLLAGVLIGAAFGMLFGVVSYALTGGKRDFTSASQVVAGRYAIVCATEHAGRARELLRGTSGSRRPGSVPAEPSARPEEDAPAADQNPYAPPRASAPPRAAEPTAESAPRPAAAPEEGAARPSQFGSRPEEPPRYGIRVPPEEGQGRDQTRDGDQS